MPRVSDGFAGQALSADWPYVVTIEHRQTGGDVGPGTVIFMQKRRGLAVASGAVTGALALAGCTVTDASAVRVNSDGSLDYVTCRPDADDWDAYFYTSEDEDEAIELQPTEALAASSEGAVVHFAPPAQDWDSLVIGASVFASVKIHFDSYTPDEWHWNTDGWSGAGTRCSIEE